MIVFSNGKYCRQRDIFKLMTTENISLGYGNKNLDAPCNHYTTKPIAISMSDSVTSCFIIIFNLSMQDANPNMSVGHYERI